MLSKRSRIAALLAAVALSACLGDAEDPARHWSGQTAAAVHVAARTHAVAVHAVLPASSARR